MINLSTNFNLNLSSDLYNGILSSKQKLPSTEFFSNQANVFMSNTRSVCQSIKKWSGIEGVASGVKALRNGDITNGLYQIATDGMPIVLLTIFTTALALKKISEFDFNEEQSNLTGIAVTPSSQLNIETDDPIELMKKIADDNFTEIKVTPSSQANIKTDDPIDLMKKTADDNFTEVEATPSSKANIKTDDPIDLMKKTADNINVIIDEHALPYNEGIPKTVPSQIHIENINEQISKRKITLVSAYDDGIKDYAQHVIPNQQAYAAKQGYNYVAYSGNLAHDQGIQRAPYWSKIVALNDQLQKTKEGEWIVWGDASAIFTNTDKNFDEIIDKYGQDKEIIVTTDPQVPINNAVFIIKNTPWTKEWIKDVWSRSDLARPGEKNCWSWGQPFCHYEQQAMTELWQSSPEVQRHTARIANNVMNSFYRYSHYDTVRNMPQNYEGDSEESKWHSKDFVCKVTGMDAVRRLKIIEYVTQNCIDKPCEFKKF